MDCLAHGDVIVLPQKTGLSQRELYEKMSFGEEQ
ncbi:DUF3949 domain-containing protein, partial [Bacillus sp. D-CC]